VDNWASIPGKDSESFVFASASRPALGDNPISSAIYTGSLSPGVKRPGCEADHSPQSSAEVKNVCNYTSTHPYVFIPWYLIKHRTRVEVYFNSPIHFHGVVLN